MGTKKKQILAMNAAPYSLINGFLYKMGLDNILRRCVLEHERDNIMHEAHYGPAGENFQADTTAKKIQQLGLWWLTLHKDYKKFVIQCDRSQKMGRPLPSIEIPSIFVNPSMTFEIWAIEFIGPFHIPAKKEQVQGR